MTDSRDRMTLTNDGQDSLGNHLENSDAEELHQIDYSIKQNTVARSFAFSS